MHLSLNIFPTLHAIGDNISALGGCQVSPLFLSPLDDPRRTFPILSYNLRFSFLLTNSHQLSTPSPTYTTTTPSPQHSQSNLQHGHHQPGHRDVGRAQSIDQGHPRGRRAGALPPYSAQSDQIHCCRCRPGGHEDGLGRGRQERHGRPFSPEEVRAVVDDTIRENRKPYSSKRFSMEPWRNCAVPFANFIVHRAIRLGVMEMEASLVAGEPEMSRPLAQGMKSQSYQETSLSHMLTS